MGRLPAAADPLIDAVSSELDQARRASGGLRGDARQRLLGRLSERDQELSVLARQILAPEALEAITLEATEELNGFKDQMAAERFARTLEIAIDRLVRARLGLPALAFK
jgi:hypothetical protein